MNDLLDLAIAAQGGMDRWRQLRALRVRFSTGGLLFTAKGQRRALDDVEGIVDLSRPRTSLFPYPAPGQRGVFEPERVWFESDRGELLEERQQPRAAFGRVRQRLWWDQLDVLYFAGYALWNYMTLPFLLARPGFVLDEIEQWTEGDERWRRLQVTFPADVPTHSPRQVFYFDARGLLRREDYTADIVTARARAAHYCFDHQAFAGLVMPTRRRVVPRRADGRALAGPTLAWLQVHTIEADSEPLPEKDRERRLI
jgi:hypothetical protein